MKAIVTVTAVIEVELDGKDIAMIEELESPTTVTMHILDEAIDSSILPGVPCEATINSIHYDEEYHKFNKVLDRCRDSCDSLI